MRALLSHAAARFVANPVPGKHRRPPWQSLVRGARVARFWLPWLLSLSVGACNAPIKPLPPVQKSGELVVITRNSPTTFYEDAEGRYAGLEHDLVELFAKQLGVKVKFLVANRFNEIIPTLQHHQAHLAAAGLSITPERERILRFGPPYQTVREEVVYNINGQRPRTVKDLVGKRIAVVAGSSYVERLKQLRKQYPGLAWHAVAAMESEELLQRLDEGESDIVIADSNVVDIAQNFYPNLAVAFTLGPPDSLAWAFPKDVDPYLLGQAREFFRRILKDGTVKHLLDRYYGHVNRLERLDVRGILEKMHSALPHYRELFEQAQEVTGIDWRLLAALSYQESHWNPFATSPTGVRGLMMLTGDTADRMGVTDRLDPKQSIPAGARYLLSLKDMVPQRIPEPDRTWLALAAYNVGYGHLEDARILAERMKLNPDSWTDLKRTLPLLSRSAYYSTVPHGYARGGEPVIFVENIRTYYDILAKFEPAYKPLFPNIAARSEGTDGVSAQTVM